MAYQFQLKNARNSIALKNISGLCTDTPEFVAILNEAQERLLDRGGWFGTQFLIRMCVLNGCITWPRYVGTVLGIRFCCTGDLEIRNNWYQIIGPRSDGWLGSDHTMVDDNTSPLFMDITGTGGKYIRLWPTKLEDVGKTVTIFGTDSGNQPLQQKIGGEWQRGMTLTLSVPYVQSPVLVSKITSVVKDVTQANILAYEYDSTTASSRQLALWEPTETNPNYRRNFIRGFACMPNPNGCKTADGVQIRKFEALVKLEFIPVVHDEDFLSIDSMTALKFMIQAIRLEEANQDQEAEVKIAKAIQALNFRERNKNPDMQMTIRVNGVGRPIVSPI